MNCYRKFLLFILPLSVLSFFISSCRESNKNEIPPKKSQPSPQEQNAESAVNFIHCLDLYNPKKKSYNFYFTYKIVHPWWDAVSLGIEDAVRQFEERGILISYDYLAPKSLSYQDQLKRLREATASGEYDVIGLDPADVIHLPQAINEVMDKGQKVMTFSSSDCGKEYGCKRIAYVGNTHNVQDGRDLAEALCKKLNYKGKVAILAGSRGAPCHEERTRGALEVIGGYKDMEVLQIEYDDDSIDRAEELTLELLSKYKDLAGLVCCNMSNPVGAARAVIKSKKEKKVLLVGMDHDKESIRYLRDGIIYALGVQDCYSIGFDTIQVAVKIADSQPVGISYPEKTDEITTIVYQADAASLLQILYGENE